jgi:hypothetical protein
LQAQLPQQAAPWHKWSVQLLTAGIAAAETASAAPEEVNDAAEIAGAISAEQSAMEKNSRCNVDCGKRYCGNLRSNFC